MGIDIKLELIRYFVIFANHNPDIWSNVIGQKVIHRTFQIGVIEETKFNGTGSTELRIRFEKLSVDIALKRFFDHVLSEGLLSLLNFDPFKVSGFSEFVEMREKEKNYKIKEEIVKEEYNILKKKRGLQDFKFEVSSPLFKILKDLETSKKPDNDSMLWLSNNIPAFYWELEYSNTNDLWKLIKASSEWRKSNNPFRSIQLLELKSTTENKIMSAILTTLGAAYRDIYELKMAVDSAENAIIKDNRSFYPHNLLGALFYQQGLPEQADAHFAKAIELGSTIRQDSSIEESLKKAGYEERITSARYLLQKDPQKYKWAQYYLK